MARGAAPERTSPGHALPGRVRRAWLLLGLGLLAGLGACRPYTEPADLALPTSTPLVQPACDPKLDLLVRRSRETYRVRGNSLDEIRASIAPQRYRDPSGQAWDAFTSWEIRWSYPFVERIDACALGRERVRVDIRMHLPRWDPPSEADPELVGTWRRYITALEAHEEGHAQIALAAACEVRQELRSLEPQPDCDRLELAADRSTQAVIDRYHELELRYDLDTDHGATDGAVLP